MNKTMTYYVVNPCPDLGQAQKCSGVKPLYGDPNSPLLITSIAIQECTFKTSINSYNKGGNCLRVAYDKHKNVTGLNRVTGSQLSPLDNSYFIPGMDII